MMVMNIVDAADQQFGAILADRRCTLRVRYNPTSDRWSLDLAIDDVPVIHGRRIVPYVDVLKPFQLGIGAIFAVPITSGAEADRESMVTGAVRLYHATQEEIDAAKAA
jgi:hypothetical protein